MATVAHDPSDERRALYDSLTVGSIISLNPLQAAVCANALVNCQQREAASAALISSKDTLETSHSNEIELQRGSGSAKSLAKRVLEGMHHLPYRKRSLTPDPSLYEGLAIASDLLLMRSVIPTEPSKQNGTNYIPSEPPNKYPQAVREAPKQHSLDARNKQASAVAPAAESPGSKKNPFISAKSKYVDEGFTLPESSKASNARAGATQQPPSEDAAITEKLLGDILLSGTPVSFDDIAGLEFAKKCVIELIVWPMTRPDLFRGLRAVPKGILLFGPPGTGKTLIGKAIAHSCQATFFNISASSLTSKWIGEGEKAVRLLFQVAHERQPAVIFIDEVDSLLSARSADENESTRRIKTEFLVQLDGAGTDATARVLAIGATNRPDELDEGARRRFVKRLYIPLPDDAGRRQLIERLLMDTEHSLQEGDMMELVRRTKGYSGADLKALCTEAAMGPVRLIIRSGRSIERISEREMPPIAVNDFMEALDAVAPSVSEADLTRYIDWNAIFGSYRRME